MLLLWYYTKWQQSLNTYRIKKQYQIIHIKHCLFCSHMFIKVLFYHNGYQNHFLKVGCRIPFPMCFLSKIVNQLECSGHTTAVCLYFVPVHINGTCRWLLVWNQYHIATTSGKERICLKLSLFLFISELNLALFFSFLSFFSLKRNGLMFILLICKPEKKFGIYENKDRERNHC